MRREKGREAIADALATLLAGPVMPAHLDASLIDRLPDAPGSTFSRRGRPYPSHR
jgi:hypothetical protein